MRLNRETVGAALAQHACIADAATGLGVGPAILARWLEVDGGLFPGQERVIAEVNGQALIEISFTMAGPAPVSDGLFLDHRGIRTPPHDQVEVWCCNVIPGIAPSSNLGQVDALIPIEPRRTRYAMAKQTALGHICTVIRNMSQYIIADVRVDTSVGLRSDGRRRFYYGRD